MLEIIKCEVLPHRHSNQILILPAVTLRCQAGEGELDSAGKLLQSEHDISLHPITGPAMTLSPAGGTISEVVET